MRYWYWPHNMRSRVYETVRCPSVCLSQHGPSAANPLLQVCCCGSGRQEIRSIAAGAAGKCGQCHVVSVRRPLNTHTRRRLQFPSLLHVISTTLHNHPTTPFPLLAHSASTQSTDIECVCSAAYVRVKYSCQIFSGEF